MKILNPVIRNLLIILLLTCTAYSKTMTILVHPFANTGDGKFSWLSAGITESVISDLGKIQDITVIAEIDREKAIREMEFSMSGFADEEKAVKTGKALGASVIFTGSYTVVGNIVRVNARLLDVEKMSVDKTVKIDGAIDKIFDVQDRIVFSLMEETGKIKIKDIAPVKIKEEDKKKIEEKERPSFSAYELYAKGLEIRDSDPAAALDYFNRALAVKPDYIDALQNAGFTAGNTLSLFDKGIDYLVKAGNIFEKKGEKETVGYSLLQKNIGVIYWNKGDLDKALEYHMKSREIKDKLGLQNSVEYSALMMNMGIVYWSKGNFDKALEFEMKSKDIQDRLGIQNRVEYSKLMMNIGVVYLSKGSLDKAIEKYMESKVIQDSLGLQNTTLYSKLMMNIGNVYQKQEDNGKSLEYYMKSGEIKERLGLQNTAEYSALMMNIGTVYEKKGESAKSLEYYMKSKVIQEGLKLQNTAGYGNLLYNMAALYVKLGNENLAGDYFRMSYNAYDKAGYKGSSKNDALNNAERLGK